jgi:hypothetical protein
LSVLSPFLQEFVSKKMYTEVEFIAMKG